MTIRTCTRSSASLLAAACAGACAGGYAAWVSLAWWRYGRPAPPVEADRDLLLDHVMPRYDVVERHRIRVEAPAAITLAAAREMDLLGLPGVRTIFATREWILGARGESDAADAAARPRGLLDNVQAMGWRVLAEAPDREIVVGAITRPWEPNPVFVGMDADAFIACREPGVVKIAWTLRADDDGAGHSIFRTETRAIATDPAARRRFRRYWSLVSPGVFLIRRLLLAPVRTEAELRARSVDAVAMEAI